MKKDEQFIEKYRDDLCASIQKTLVNMLFNKLKKASKKTGINQIAIAGGVSANSELRNRLNQEKHKYQWEIFIPSFQYCTDNAGMIAMAAHFLYEAGEFSSYEAIPQPRLQI